MATDKDKVKIEINIVGERLQLTVESDRKNRILKYEKAINDRYSKWRKKFPKKNSSELIAMIMFQYASFYYDLESDVRQLNADMTTLSDDLDHLLQSPEDD